MFKQKMYYFKKEKTPKQITHFEFEANLSQISWDTAMFTNLLTTVYKCVGTEETSWWRGMAPIWSDRCFFLLNTGGSVLGS